MEYKDVFRQLAQLGVNMKTKRITCGELLEWLQTRYDRPVDVSSAFRSSRQTANQLWRGEVKPSLSTLEKLGVELIVPAGKVSA